MITLASDFGTPYPATMKGVILRQCDARLVDIAHDFPRQDVRAAAFWLREVLPEFPPATHLVVVDPGVGTDRAAIVVEAGGHRIVAPDNGVALPAARRLADDDEAIAVYEVAYDDDETASNTFHGRDVFAPAAARVHEVDEVAHADGVVSTDDWVDMTFPEPIRDQDAATGEVLVVDGFGNAITNIPGHVLDGHSTVRVNDEFAPVEDAYAEMDPGERLVTVGSHGNVEFAVNQGRGDEAFDLAVGDDVSLSW
ncbi:S-adenosyl-l-methionine hydroxide adenosyltransferase [Halolamina pelagica]|uniref:S-adenosyl-l-methionine hydroxide adenosyltransferase n=1 Tax=Halolamina pelagica TaxID=699431 RepID=A0A0P7I0S9_9EURY|nr:SAM-dependent chlorinase/fluorinase [Halolamina pelagica]KPN30280.1 S-adenosyl-l-methionine hydroxide adenosyltransferase [Halolamina pelagica]